MIIGVPKEIKNHEYRIGLTPSGVFELVKNGHTVLVQQDAGVGVGYADTDYTNAGAEIIATAKDIFARADMIVKVKEPQLNECAMLRPEQVLFTYLHLAPDPGPNQRTYRQRLHCHSIRNCNRYRWTVAIAGPYVRSGGANGNPSRYAQP